MPKFLVWFRVIFRRLVSRCPRRLRVFAGPLLGGLIGLIGGIPGFFIGLLLGYFLRELFVQSFRDKRILEYYENPGYQHFYESESGLAAWCGLAVLVVSHSFDESPSPLTVESMLKRVILEASCVFTGPLSEPFLIEHFSRLAWSRKDSLNSDLLAESLMARRAPLEAQAELGKLGRGLRELAGGEKSKTLAREILLILDPSLADEKEPGMSEPGILGTVPGDPWIILGLTPGTPLREVKAHYRRLAKQFHPDEFVSLDERHRESAARAFMTIQEAYKEISGG